MRYSELRATRDLFAGQLTSQIKYTDWAEIIEATLTLQEIDALLDNHADEELTKEDLKKWQDFFKHRFDRVFKKDGDKILPTTLSYPYCTNSKTNELCIALAKKIAPELNCSAIKLLLPTIHEEMSNITATDLNEIDISNIQLSDDGQFFIEPDVVFENALGDGIFKHTQKVYQVPGKTKELALELSSSEKNRLINFIPEAKPYADAIQERHQFMTNGTTLGALLKSLIEGLHEGDVHRNGDEHDAGKDANLAILDFSRAYDSLSPADKEWFDQLPLNADQRCSLKDILDIVLCLNQENKIKKINEIIVLLKQQIRLTELSKDKEISEKDWFSAYEKIKADLLAWTASLQEMNNEVKNALAIFTTQLVNMLNKHDKPPRLLPCLDDLKQLLGEATYTLKEVHDSIATCVDNNAQFLENILSENSKDLFTKTITAAANANVLINYDTKLAATKETFNKKMQSLAADEKYKAGFLRNAEKLALEDNVLNSLSQLPIDNLAIIQELIGKVSPGDAMSIIAKLTKEQRFSIMNVLKAWLYNQLPKNMTSNYANDVFWSNKTVYIDGFLKRRKFVSLTPLFNDNDVGGIKQVVANSSFIRILTENNTTFDVSANSEIFLPDEVFDSRGLLEIKQLCGFDFWLTTQGKLIYSQAVSPDIVDVADFFNWDEKTSLESIVQGKGHFLFLDTKGEVWAYGKNHKGQLGLGDKDPKVLPQKIAFPTHAKIKSIVAGYKHSLFLTEAGEVFACGDNTYGQLGCEDLSLSLTPIKIPFPAGVKIDRIQSYNKQNLFFADSKEIYVFGNNYNKQLGLPDVDKQMTPVLFPYFDHGKKVNHAAFGETFTAFFVDGKVYICGRSGRLGCLRTTLHDGTELDGNFDYDNNIDVEKKEPRPRYMTCWDPIFKLLHELEVQEKESKKETSHPISQNPATLFAIPKDSRMDDQAPANHLKR